jgi:hypothetical protein
MIAVKPTSIDADTMVQVLQEKEGQAWPDIARSVTAGFRLRPGRIRKLKAAKILVF